MAESDVPLQVGTVDLTVVDVAHPRFGTLRQVGCPVRVDDLAPRYRAASALGADTDELLRDLLGLPDSEIRDLRARGAI